MNKDWKSVDINEDTKCDQPGIYRIRLMKSGEPIEIPRFNGVDKDGVLAIGCSENIERRRKQFIRASKGNHGHSEGIQWYLVHHCSGFEKKDYSLQFQFLQAKSKEDAKRVEEDELWDYFCKYSEAPPLNSSLPRREKKFDEIRKV